jgi:hypothetical protein
MKGGTMKGTLLAVVAASLLFAVPSIAFDGGQAEQGSGATFEQRKSEFLVRIDQRLARLQEVRACVSAAATPEALRACMARQGGETGQNRQRNGQ